MDNIEMQISGFRDFANERLKAQVLALNKFKHSHLVSGKLAKIKLFNEQLDIFKNELNQMMRTIVARFDKGNRAELEAGLSKITDEFVSEYMCLSFIKDDA